VRSPARVRCSPSVGSSEAEFRLVLTVIAKQAHTTEPLPASFYWCPFRKATRSVTFAKRAGLGQVLSYWQTAGIAPVRSFAQAAASAEPVTEKAERTSVQ